MNVRKWKKACTKVEKGMYESGMRNVERGMYETTKVEAFFDESTNVDYHEESRAACAHHLDGGGRGGHAVEGHEPSAGRRGTVLVGHPEARHTSPANASNAAHVPQEP